MRELIALDIAASHQLVDVIKAVWDSGNAFAPIDQRLPAKAKQRLIESLQPSLIMDSSGTVTRLENAMPIEDGQCLAMATSGTTGNPKIVMYSMNQISASAQATSNYIGVTSADKWLCCLQISHIGGLSVVLRAMLLGNPIEIHDGFEADRVKMAAKDGATLVSLVPAALAQLDPYIFRKIILGGSKPPPQIPNNAMITYGLTETGSGMVYEGSPLHGAEIKISANGEILLKGPMIATSYRTGMPIQDQFGWFHTNDAGSFTGGKLQVFGRMDEIINTGGEKVFPGAIESVLESHPKVRQVAVIALPDPKWGEAVTAVVVPNPLLEPPQLEEIRDLVKSELPPYCAPTRLHIVRKLPTTNLGKIQKNILKDQFS